MARLIDADELRAAWLDWSPDDTFDANDVLYSIDEQPTVEQQSPWISVKDRLPEYSFDGSAKAYWVAFDTRHGKEMQLALYCGYMNVMVTALPECVTWRDWESHKINKVTHWMPLPEPPEEEAP